LAHNATKAERSALRTDLTVPVFRLPAGSIPEPAPPGGLRELGYLVLKGRLIYEVRVLGRATAELLGPGDVIRPWARRGPATVSAEAHYTALEQVLLGALGALDRHRLDGSAEVLAGFVNRCADRADSAAIQRSIAAHVRVDVRLLAYLWHLADRFGIVIPGAVRLDVPLTHAVLARLVGARRPTVTTALQRLMQLGYLKRDARTFVLVGDASAIEELERRSPARDFALPTH
jgi:hypothetical protein